MSATSDRVAAFYAMAGGPPLAATFGRTPKAHHRPWFERPRRPSLLLVCAGLAFGVFAVAVVLAAMVMCSLGLGIVWMKVVELTH